MIFSDLFVTINFSTSTKCSFTKYLTVSNEAINRLLKILKYIVTWEFITSKKIKIVLLNNRSNTLKYSVTRIVIVLSKQIKLRLTLSLVII